MSFAARDEQMQDAPQAERHLQKRQKRLRCLHQESCPDEELPSPYKAPRWVEVLDAQMNPPEQPEQPSYVSGMHAHPEHPMWKKAAASDAAERHAVKEKVRAVVEASIYHPLDFHDVFIHNCGTLVKEVGLEPLHHQQFHAPKLPHFGDGWNNFFEHLLNDVLAADSMEHRAIARVRGEAALISACEVVEFFYGAAVEDKHWLEAPYRSLLFRDLRKARRLWVKAIHRVLHKQRLLRAQEEAENAAQLHAPGGAEHAAFLAASAELGVSWAS